MEFLNETPLTKPLIFDTHAHYDDARYDGGLNELISTMHEKGVGGIVTCGCDFETSKKALEIANGFDFVYAAVGIHPEFAAEGYCLSEIEALAQDKKCVAIGEIGLDYYWTQDNKPLQKQLFKDQLDLAKRLDLPVLMHDREAHADTMEILKEYHPKGVLHSFSGSVEMAKEVTDLGIYIGIGGVVTFKNAKKLPDVVKSIPEDKLLLETDAPYLAPVPYRSKTNHSAMIYLIAQKVAEIRETDVEHILNVTFENAKRLFGL